MTQIPVVSQLINTMKTTKTLIIISLSVFTSIGVYILSGCNTMAETPPCAVGEWLGSYSLHVGCVTEFGLTINENNTGILKYYPCPDTCSDGAIWLESTSFSYYFLNDTNMVRMNTQMRMCNEDWVNISGVAADTIYINCDGNHMQFGTDIYFTRQ